LRKLLVLSLLLLSLPAAAQVTGQNHTTYRGQASAPAAPGSGLYRVYVDNSGVLKIVNSSGTASSVGSPGGSTTQVQYNNAGAFAGSASFTYSASSAVLSGTPSPGITVAGNVLSSPAAGLMDFVLNGGTRGLRVADASVFGTNDTFFQAFPGASGYGVFEGYAGAGVVLASSNNTPVLIAPNRTTLATFRRDASPNLLLTAANAAHVPLRVGLAASQSANAFEVLNSSSTTLTSITKDGYLSVAVGTLAAPGVQFNSTSLGIAGVSGNLNLIAGSNELLRLDSGSGVVRVSGVYGLGMGVNLGSTDILLNRGAAKVLRLSDGSSGGVTFSAPATTPSQITADQNNYTPSGSSYFQRWSSDASRNVTGMTFTATQVDGQQHQIWNVGSQNIVLVNESASSTAANRFTTSTGADLTLAAAKCANVVYDGTTSRWRASLCN
jgi:hypothetical protein